MDYGYSDFMELCVDNLFNAFDKREKDPNEIEDVKIFHYSTRYIKTLEDWKMNKQHALKKVKNLKRSNGIDRDKVLKIVNELIYPDEPLRGLLDSYKYLEKVSDYASKMDICFTELLERLCWMWIEGYCNCGISERKKLVSLFIKTMNMWDEWIDEQAREYNMEDILIEEGLYELPGDLKELT